MAATIPVDGPPVAVTLATTCALVTTDGTTVAEAQWAYISSDTVGSTDVVRLVYSDSLADAGALPASGYHELACSTLPKMVPVRGRRLLLQGSSAFAVQVELIG